MAWKSLDDYLLIECSCCPINIEQYIKTICSCETEKMMNVILWGPLCDSRRNNFSITTPPRWRETKPSKFEWNSGGRYSFQSESVLFWVPPLKIGWSEEERRSLFPNQTGGKASALPRSASQCVVLQWIIKPFERSGSSLSCARMVHRNTRDTLFFLLSLKSIFFLLLAAQWRRVEGQILTRNELSLFTALTLVV